MAKQHRKPKDVCRVETPKKETRSEDVNISTDRERA